jgi:Fe-S-cluster-containing dehydrogenase component
MVIDLAICNGCHNCQVACKDEHVGNDWTPIARPQPDTGQFWNKVIDLERGTVPKVQVTYHHSICQHCGAPDRSDQHCEEAPCISACNAHAIYRREDGIVIIDPTKCRGNQLCIAACPYENVIFFNDDLGIAQKCTFCAHLIDAGWTETRCSDACPTGAFTFGEEADPKIAALLAQAELLKPALATRPRVYYLNLPKKWIAGAVFDPEADECLQGATVTAANLTTGERLTVTTDNYGDFWLRNLPDGTYTLLVEKPGYLAKKLGPIDATSLDQNVGDVELWKGDAHE